MRALGAGRLELVDGHQVPGVLAGEDLDRHAAGQLDRLGVGGPVRGGQQHLVAGVEQRGERLVDRLLAAVGHQDLVRLDLVAGVPCGLGDDRGLEVGQAAGRRVAVVRRVGTRGGGGLDDVAGRREVGLAGAEPDHRAPLGLERLGLGVHGQRGRLGDRPDPGRHPAPGHGHARGCGLAHGAALLGHDSNPVTRTAFGVSPCPPVVHAVGRLALVRPVREGCVHSTRWLTTAMLRPAQPQTGRGRVSTPKGSGAIGSAPVSKTGGCGFESLLPCGSAPRDRPATALYQNQTRPRHLPARDQT